MHSLAPFCLLAILYVLGRIGKPTIDRAILILTRKSKEMHEEAKRITKLIDNEWSRDGLSELWDIINDFRKVYRFVPNSKRVTGRLHAHRLNRAAEIFPTVIGIKSKILSELALTPVQEN